MNLNRRKGDSDGSMRSTTLDNVGEDKGKRRRPYSMIARAFDPNQRRIHLGFSIVLLLALFRLAWYMRTVPTAVGSKRAAGIPTARSTRVWTEPPLPANITLAELLAHPTLPPAKRLKVDYPIFVASFSKSGTTSTFFAFACYLGNDYVAHRWTTDVHIRRPELIGRCVEQNVLRHAPPFEGCGTNYFNRTQTVVWSDTSYIGGDHGCYNPNLQALEAIWEAHPTATLLLVRRNATAWYRSASNGRARFIQHWTGRCPGMPTNASEAVWVEFYNNHTERVRRFAADRRGQMTYVEIELEDPNSGKILEDKLGLPASCWKKCSSSFVRDPCQEIQVDKSEKEQVRQKRRLLQEMDVDAFSVSWSNHQ